MGKKVFGRCICLSLALLIALQLPIAPCRADDATDLAAYFRNSHAKTEIIRPPHGLLKHEYLVPSGPYAELFDWDAYFMGVALSYDGVSKPLMGSTENFLEFLDQRGPYTGYIPREIAPEGLWALPRLPGVLGAVVAKLALKIGMLLKDHQWISQYLGRVMALVEKLTPPFLRSLPEQCKPMLAQMALRTSLTADDFTWITPYYDRLVQSLMYWESSRRAPDGLFVWYDGLESGTDNSYVVSNSPAQTTEGVDLQVYIYREYQALATIAAHINKTDDAKIFADKAEELRALIIAKMWSEQDGFFYNVDSRTGQQIPLMAWTGFTVLWAKIPSPTQARRMIADHLLSTKEFWAPFGVRTAPATSKRYDPNEGYWRGPVWVISNYIVMHGLMNYGYQQEALQLAQVTTKLLLQDFKTTGSTNECYNPETGKPIANGNFVSWNLLAEHMISEATTGFDPTTIAK